MSVIVTTAGAVDVLPLPSVAVKTTLLTPKSAQVNAPTLTVRAGGPQLSVDPLSISAPTIVAFPVASSGTVMF